MMSAPSGKVRRIVLFGHPVAHSLSAVFQNAAIAAAGIAAQYEAVDVAPGSFAAVFAGMRDTDGAGNVTVPHKAAAFAACDARTAVAERVGAVNTFWVEAGRIIGDNTDVIGVRAAIASLGVTSLRGVRVALLGSGGAAAAVLAALCDEAATVRIWSRSPARGEALRARFARPSVHVTSDIDAACLGADLIINATPLGLTGDALPMAPERLNASARVLDLAYRRIGTTPWVTASRAAGLRAEDGLTMLVAQGAAAFRQWFGFEPDVDVMWDALRRAREDSASGRS
jgi:shikimate dehydrogenase